MIRVIRVIRVIYPVETLAVIVNSLSSQHQNSQKHTFRNISKILFILIPPYHVQQRGREKDEDEADDQPHFEHVSVAINHPPERVQTMEDLFGLQEP